MWVGEGRREQVFRRGHCSLVSDVKSPLVRIHAITEVIEVSHLNDFLHSSGFRKEIRYSGQIVSVADNKLEQ